MCGSTQSSLTNMVHDGLGVPHLHTQRRYATDEDNLSLEVSL